MGTPELTPELERYILWAKFSAILLARGVKSEEYREDFERTLELVKDLPFEEKQKKIEEFALKIAPPPAPPVVLAPPAPPVAPMPAPNVIVRYCKICGSPFIGPDEATLYYLERVLPQPADYWLSCTTCKRRYFGYPPAYILINEAIEYRRVDPGFWDYLRSLKELLRGRE
jgi:hypothetical protein